MQSNGARALVGIATLVVIIVAFVVISGGNDSGESGDEGASTQAATPETITLQDGQPVDGIAELTYQQGDEVDIVVKSDVETEIHLHGYDVEEAVTPGQPAEFAFTADLEGKFEMEDHHTEAQIAEITVNP